MLLLISSHGVREKRSTVTQKEGEVSKVHAVRGITVSFIPLEQCVLRTFECQSHSAKSKKGTGTATGGK